MRDWVNKDKIATTRKKKKGFKDEKNIGCQFLSRQVNKKRFKNEKKHSILMFYPIQQYIMVSNSQSEKLVKRSTKFS